MKAATCGTRSAMPGFGLEALPGAVRTGAAVARGRWTVGQACRLCRPSSPGGRPPALPALSLVFTAGAARPRGSPATGLAPVRPPLPGSRRWAGRRGAVKAKAVSLLTSCAPGLKAPPHASALAGEGAPRAAAMVGRPCRGRDHPLVSVRSLRLLGVALTPRYCALTREGSYAQQSVSTLKTHSSADPVCFQWGN